MGREIKRVALDFAWPLSEPWSGFLNPHYDGHCFECTDCGGRGLNAETLKIDRDWYAFDKPYLPVPNDPRGRRMSQGWSHKLTQDEVLILAREGRLWDFVARWTRGHGWRMADGRWEQARQLACKYRRLAQNTRVRAKRQRLIARARFYDAVCDERARLNAPSAALVNEWSVMGFGHDAINQGICVRARARRLGVYGMCPRCKGHGSVWDSADSKKIAEAWQPAEPPAGDGWQMWETVSEGSPVTPVFATADELIEWLCSGKGHDTYSRKVAENFVRGSGWAPSFIGNASGFKSGVEALAEAK